MSIPPQIFKAYDIRGIYGKEITEETAEIIGKALGTYFFQNKVHKIAVGQDNRVSSPSLAQALIKGIAATGTHLVDMGTVITPMIYFSWHHLGLDGSVMVTASHNPPEYNGFKVGLNKSPIYSSDYEEIKSLASHPRGVKLKLGRVEKRDIWPDYKRKILEDVKLSRPLKVVVDTGNGTTGLFVPELLKELGCEVIELFTESDGRFPNHPPYPSKTEYYKELIQKIKEVGADAGLAFDGDGDRLGVYDEQGRFMENDFLAAIFSRDVLFKTPGASVVLNISASIAVLEDIEARGGRAIFAKTGYPFITQKMEEEGALFGAEISGHFFFKDRYFGYDDALYAASRFLEILANNKIPASQLISDMPSYIGTPEFRARVQEGVDRFEVVQKAKEELRKTPGVEILDIDGVRFTFPDKSWGLIRASNTESVIAIRAEAKTRSRLKEVQDLIEGKLTKQSVTLNWRG